MRRLAWSQLRFRSARLAALLAGMLLATTAFTVLTAASRTAQLRTVGTVSAHFVPAYEILVRPPGARTSLETQTGTVQPNLLTGTYGGISMAQYHQIQQIPGVQVEQGSPGTQPQSASVRGSPNAGSTALSKRVISLTWPPASVTTSSPKARATSLTGSRR
jgi:hypothetical protein